MTHALCTLLLLLLPPSQEDGKPLPDLQALKGSLNRIIDAVGSVGDSVQQRSRPGERLRQITYTETETVESLDSKGKPKERETNVYQVIQGVEPWEFYRKHISRNGVPLASKELDKQDREQERHERKERERAERELKKAEETRSKQPPPPMLTPEKQREQKELTENLILDYYSSIYEIRAVRRETIDGFSTVMVRFTPKPDAKASDSFLKVLQHLSIDAWLTEDRREIARLEVHVAETLSFGLGLLARFHRDSTMSIERRPVHGDTWAPVRMAAAISARILLVKGLRRRITSEYSDFKRYTVETTLEVGDPVEETP